MLIQKIVIEAVDILLWQFFCFSCFHPSQHPPKQLAGGGGGGR